jgi:hypothetical protein
MFPKLSLSIDYWLTTTGFAHARFSLQIVTKYGADERTRTAYPCSSYEFA